MLENMTVLTNKEYAELVIKAHKYDMLREIAISSDFMSMAEEIIFEIARKKKNTTTDKKSES